MAPLSRVTTKQSRGRGGAKSAEQDVKEAVLSQTCLFFDQTGTSWQQPNVEEDVKLKQ